MLVLDIFAQHAKSKGKAQVSLAQLEYLIHIPVVGVLSKIKGTCWPNGGVGLRAFGETNETDRRRIRTRWRVCVRLRHGIARDVKRANRQRSTIPQIAIAVYQRW